MSQHSPANANHYVRPLGVLLDLPVSERCGPAFQSGISLPMTPAEWFVIKEALSARSESVHRWIPVTERLPKHREQVLVQGGIAYWRDPCPEWPDGKFYTITAMEWPGRPIQWDVTHWMPFPEEPK